MAKDNNDKEDVVSVPKAAFDELTTRLAKMEEELKLSRAVEDTNKLQKIENLRRQGKLVKEVKLRNVDGEPVIGWKTIKDEVFFQDGKLIENQMVEVWVDGGAKKELTMRQWAALPTYDVFEVLRETKDEDGNIFFKVRRADGRELEINQIYVN